MKTEHAADKFSEHRYDDDGVCEVCGQSRECTPLAVKTVCNPTTTGEWTASLIGEILHNGEVMATANAALAAERERTEQFARAQAKANARLCELEPAILQLREQLEAAQASITHCVKIWKMRGSDDHWNGHMQNAYNECADELKERVTQ